MHWKVGKLVKLAKKWPLLISNTTSKNGLEPIVNTPSGNSFLQTFDLVKIIPHNTWIKIGDDTHENLKDFFYTGNDTYKDPLKSTLAFVGEGNDEDYKAIPTQGKNVLIYSDGNRKVRREKTDLAREHGAINVFIISSGTEDDFNKTLKMYQLFCDQRGIDAQSQFKLLIEQYMGGKLRGPFNWPARLEAGFAEAELSALEQGL